MMGIFLKIFKTVLIALAGVFIANKFNLFSYMTFIPDDKAFDICITVYFTILELISEFLLEAVHGRRSELSVILSHVNTDVSIKSNPIINFNQDDLAQMTVTVHINGMKKHFTGSKIVLSDVGFATMQANTRVDGAGVDTDGNYIIHLDRLFGAAETKTLVSSSFRVVFAKAPIPNAMTFEMSPEFKTNTRFRSHSLITYKHNKATLRAER